MIKLNSAAELLDEQGQTESLIVIAESGTLKDSSECPEPALIKTDSADRVMFSDSMDLQIDSSKMVDTKDGLLVKDAIICRAMVLDYNGKKILKSPETLADSMPTMQRMMITDEHPRSRVIIDVSEIKGRVLPETVKLNNNVATGDLLITDQKNMLLTRAELLDYGNGKEHLFIWSEVINNIETPNKVILTLNPNTGEIITYTGIQRQLTVPLEPRILKDDALNIATSQFKDITVERIDAKLSVEYPTENVQKLTWVIEIEGKPRDNVPQGGLVVVDATTGEVIVVKPYL